MQHLSYQYLSQSTTLTLVPNPHGSLAGAIDMTHEVLRSMTVMHNCKVVQRKHFVIILTAKKTENKMLNQTPTRGLGYFADLRTCGPTNGYFADLAADVGPQNTHRRSASPQNTHTSTVSIFADR